MKQNKQLHTIKHHVCKIKEGKGEEKETHSICQNSAPVPPAQWKMGGKLYLFRGWSTLE